MTPPPESAKRPARIVVLLPLLLFVAVNGAFLVAFRYVHMDTVIRIAYDTNTLLFPVLFLLLATFHWRRHGRESRLPWAWLGLGAAVGWALAVLSA